MTKKQAITELESYLKDDSHDWELVHGRADDILCAVLVELGADDVVDAYRRCQDHVGFYYA